MEDVSFSHVHLDIQTIPSNMKEKYLGKKVVSLENERKTRLSFEVFSLESPWTLDYVLAPLPPLGIGLSVAVREGE